LGKPSLAVVDDGFMTRSGEDRDAISGRGTFLVERHNLQNTASWKSHNGEGRVLWCHAEIYDPGCLPTLSCFNSLEAVITMSLEAATA
jgi:hypothetical protein